MKEVLERPRAGASGAARAAPPRRAWLPDAAALAVIAAVLVYYWARVVELFPLSEFVQWIAWQARPMLEDSVEAMVTFRADGFSRHDSMVYATALGRVCGSNLACINTFAFLPIVGGAALLYALGRVLRLSAAAAAVVVVVWLVSQPAFDVLRWQATLHDRLASMFVPGLLLCTMLAVRAARPSPRYIVPVTLGLTVLALLTLNTKEPAWVVVPMLALAPVLLARDRAQAKLATYLLAVPVAAMAIHVITHLQALNDDPLLRAHVGGGSIAHNLPVLTRIAVPGGLAVLIALTLVGLAALVLAVRGRARSPAAFEAARAAAWIGIGALASFVIPLRTEFTSPFYMFVPLELAALAFALSVRAGLLALPPLRRASPRILAVAIGAAALAWFAGSSALGRWDQYEEDWLRPDANFRAAMPQLKRVHAAHPNQKIVFYSDSPRANKWVTTSRADRLWRLIGPVLPVDRTYGSSAQRNTCGGGDTIVIRLDAQMRWNGVCPE